MASGKQTRRRRARAFASSRQGRRLRLPDGTSIDVPDRDDPAWDAIDRLKAGRGRPGDEQAADAFMARVDPRYWAYLAYLARGPRDVTDVLGGRVVGDKPPAVRVILMQLNDLAESGELGMCLHVRPRAPRPAVWVPWAPRKLRCPDCATIAGAGIAGTTADRQCDMCGHIGKGINKLSFLTAPVEYRQVVVPIFVTFGLCNRCAGPEVVRAQHRSPAAV